MEERAKNRAQKYERENQGTKERESVNAKARNLRLKKKPESACARGFHAGARKRKREDRKKYVPRSACLQHLLHQLITHFNS
jgi:hypothetical protein